MLKLIFLFIVAYFLFKLLKMLLGKAGAKGQKSAKPSYSEAPRQISEMVQDPVCKIYIPKKDALHLEHAGARHYFCCRNCLDEFCKQELIQK